MNLKRPLNKLIFNIVVLNILVFLLTWIIGAISFLIYQNNYLGSFKDDFTTSVNLVEQSYLNFKHDVELDDIWKYSSDYNLESLPAYDLDSDLIIANASELNISELSEDNLMLVMIDHVNRLIAYTKIEDVFKINEFSKRIVLLNQYEGYIYYTNDESLTNQTFYYYLSERNASFVRGLFDQTNNFSSINYKFDQRNTLINFSYPVDNLILVELVNATLFNTIINSIKIILFVLLGFGGSLYLVIKYLLNHRFDSSKKDITSILKYNDRNLLIWVYADGAIIDYNLTVSKTFNVGTKVKHLDNLFLNDEINYELYIRQQISFIVNVNDQIYEFTSILQKNGYLLVGRMATSSSIEVNKYREIAYSNLVTNLPNQLSLYESYPSFNLRDEPYLVGLSIVDYEHIETLLGLEFTNELLNEIKN